VCYWFPRAQQGQTLLTFESGPEIAGYSFLLLLRTVTLSGLLYTVFFSTNIRILYGNYSSLGSLLLLTMTLSGLGRLSQTRRCVYWFTTEIPILKSRALSRKTNTLTTFQPTTLIRKKGGTHGREERRGWVSKFTPFFSTNIRIPLLKCAIDFPGHNRLYSLSSSPSLPIPYPPILGLRSFAG
jgi:hypothetical protein